MPVALGGGSIGMADSDADRAEMRSTPANGWVLVQFLYAIDAINAVFPAPHNFEVVTCRTWMVIL
jgi:hypothetical protein